MKITNYKIPKSSFLSIDKDFSIIVDKFLSNERLKRLLYYTTPDALSRPNLTEEQSLSLFGNNIKIVPKLYVDNSVLCYIVISFDNFILNNTNPEFRDNIIAFDIICHFDQWNLKDCGLRPYKIAAEIDTLLDKQHLTGIGKLQFLGADQINLTSEYAGLSLIYSATHGEEDKKQLQNPVEDEAFIKEFNERENQH